VRDPRPTSGSDGGASARLTRESAEGSRKTLCPLSPARSPLSALLDRTGKVFRERYDPTQILDEKAMVEKLGYVHADPCNANLVDRAVDWP
jgi:hypothetical protein